MTAITVPTYGLRIDQRHTDHIAELVGNSMPHNPVSTTSQSRTPLVYDLRIMPGYFLLDLKPFAVRNLGTQGLDKLIEVIRQYFRIWGKEEIRVA